MISDSLLAEQIAYYNAIASEYEDHSIDAPGQSQLIAAFESFDIGGEVLEITCGTGLWTHRLADRADSLTTVDASPEMIAIAQQRIGNQPVRFIHADLFTWQPDATYDAVFFGFWLSHVPDDHFDAFWALVAACLRPNGQVFFLDDNHRTPEELIEGPNSPIVQRRLNDGKTYRAIKVPHQPSTLQPKLRQLGWNITINSAGPFYWGSGTSHR